MATRIPYEDVQRAAKEITSCLSNVVTVRPSSIKACETRFVRLGGERALATAHNCAGSGLQSRQHPPR